MIRYLSCLALAGLISLPMPVAAGERDRGIDDRPGVGQPLRFRDALGGAFQPTELVIVIPGGAVRAPLPEAALHARSEDRVDLSDTPLVGGLFQETLNPDDASAGTAIGPVYRRGDRLIVDAGGTSPEVQASPVVLTSNLPRLGAVSYTVGPLEYRKGGGVLRTDSDPIGTAYLLDGRFVIAAEGGSPAWPSVESLFNGIFD